MRVVRISMGRVWSVLTRPIYTIRSTSTVQTATNAIPIVWFAPHRMAGANNVCLTMWLVRGGGANAHTVHLKKMVFAFKQIRCVIRDTTMTD